MAKLKEKVARPGEPKTKETKEAKNKESKGKSKLVGRVKKVIKKSRRRLGEEKFEKELQRTIEFLGQLQLKLGALHAAKENGNAPAKAEKKTELKAVTKVEKKGRRNAPKKARPDKKNGKKSAGHDANGGNGVGKKRKGLQIKDSSPVTAPTTLQVEAASKQR